MLKGTLWMKSLSPASRVSRPTSAARPLRYAAHAEIGTRAMTEAEVESQMYASFSRETRWRSVRSRITAPTKRGLK